MKNIVRCQYLHSILKAIVVVIIFLFLGHLVSALTPTTVSFPILLYHEINETGEGDSSIAKDVFLTHLDAMKDAGYQTITFEQIIDYVENGTELPSNPILITFDDGYLSNYSNYEIAWPALAERGMTGTIFVIGHAVGKNTYKDTGIPTLPHFSYAQAREMIESGTISVQSHTYDLHQYQPLEPNSTYREGVLPHRDEEPEEYRRALYTDFRRSVSELETQTGEPLLVLAYPYGLYTQDSEEICSDLGIQVTLTTRAEPAQVVRGDPSSLRLLGRHSIDDCSPEELLALLADEKR